MELERVCNEKTNIKLPIVLKLHHTRTYSIQVYIDMFDMTILIHRNLELKISKGKSLKVITTKHKIGVVHRH